MDGIATMNIDVNYEEIYNAIKYDETILKKILIGQNFNNENFILQIADKCGKKAIEYILYLRECPILDATGNEIDNPSKDTLLTKKLKDILEKSIKDELSAKREELFAIENATFSEDEHTEENKLPVVAKKNTIFASIRNFFINLFKKKEVITPEEPNLNAIKIQDENRKNNFLGEIKILSKEEKYYELQRKYHSEEISIEDLKIFEIKKICDIYDKKILEYKK
ncbi:MAG: hypothetical protein E7310_08600 [Clostridiales bacterium]|nr:hypothetical protein [Clostridiales bacterium]